MDTRLLANGADADVTAAVVTRVAVALHRWSEDHGGAAYAGVNVDLAQDTHLEPDVVWTSDTDQSRLGLARTPELVVEVGSPSTHRYDRGIKLQRHLASGALEVWLVDLEGDEVEVHRSGDEPLVLGRRDTLTTTVLPGFAVPVDDLLGPRPATT